MAFRSFAIVAPIALLLVPATYAGETTYSADDIVNFFTAGTPQITRGICVGTDAQCQIEREKRATSFDLLINFSKNSAELSDEAQGKLIQFSLALHHPKLADKKFAVDGFTDASGSDQHNLALSERRANAVVSYLNSLGVDAARLEARGFGETRFRVPDAYDPINRRVETRIIGE
jgi:outer membrane protein OmpA-like peptidoglycan-associated protein